MDTPSDDWKDLPIREVVPHRGTMCLLKQITNYAKGTITTLAEIRPDNPFFMDDRGVPICIGFEYMAQTMAAFAGLTARRDGVPVKLGVLVGCRRAHCAQPFFVSGQRLRITAILEWKEEGMGNFNATISDDETGSELMSGRINVYQPNDPRKYFNLTGTD
ncbi:MAG: hypothetical protein OSB41_06955 [Kiritimatiellae bacterium]|jgi:predicted hotdog family 3-hydroxylacyl-ACP dehydratase|nr:hypothetical protein [Kiritimatiellia bacterium]